jgi:hypothetical protein
MDSVFSERDGLAALAGQMALHPVCGSPQQFAGCLIRPGVRGDMTGEND